MATMDELVREMREMAAQQQADLARLRLESARFHAGWIRLSGELSALAASCEALLRAAPRAQPQVALVRFVTLDEVRQELGLSREDVRRAEESHTRPPADPDQPNGATAT